MSEKRGRTHRYGAERGLVDLGRGCMMPYDEMLELIDEHAEALNCAGQIPQARAILERGTSAHDQVARYQQDLGNGASEAEALQSVVDFPIDETQIRLVR